MLYGYKKATLKNPHPGRIIPTYLKTVPTIISALGLGLVAFVAYPLVSYQLKDTDLLAGFKNGGLLSPISYESVANNQDTGPTVAKGGVDYTKASSWFPGSIQNDLFALEEKSQSAQTNKPTSYSISIPSLGITEATVSINDEDLTKHLVHFPQTALPGQLGSPVIFGHSTLPQFYDPKKYTAIFSTLPNIKVGSDIFVSYDNIEYTYRVAKLYEVKPNELWVLRQDYSQKTIKVVTCVPPGTTLRRLIVEADLVKN